MKQVFNPYMPSYEYIPDGEPHVFGNRVYVYGSHDKFGGSTWCENDYVVWSAPVNDLTDWRFGGVIYRKNQDIENPRGTRYMYAPDVACKNGKYYLYYTLDDMISTTSVAVADSPEGPFEYYGKVRYDSGVVAGSQEKDFYQFDPAVFVDDDGCAYLYSGFETRPVEQEAYDKRGQTYGLFCYRLADDMLTVLGEPKLLIPNTRNLRGTSFENHGFHEGSSMRKFGDTYYLIYSSQNRNELCYATSKQPDGGFTYRGVLVSNGDVGLDGVTEQTCRNYMGNNHGSLTFLGGKYYIFYHRQTNKHSFSRQACAEEIIRLADGTFKQAEMTSCGLNGKPLAGAGEYPAYIACNLYSGSGGVYYDEGVDLRGLPYFTQSGGDRESDGDQYIAELRDGAVVGYKYFDLSDTREITLCLRGSLHGSVEIATEEKGKAVAKANIALDGKAQKITLRINGGTQKSALYFRVFGEGYADFLNFVLL